MIKKRRTFDASFKRQVVKLVVEQGLSVAQPGGSHLDEKPGSDFYMEIDSLRPERLLHQYRQRAAMYEAQPFFLAPPRLQQRRLQRVLRLSRKEKVRHYVAGSGVTRLLLPMPND